MSFKAGLAIAAALAVGGCDLESLGPGDRFKSDFHYSYDSAPGQRLDVQTFNGAIEIDGWDQNKVEIDGSKYGATEQLRDAVRINISPSAGAITIRAERPSGVPGSMGARFTIHAPKTEVIGRAVTSNGAVRISDVAGDGHLTTSNGAIRVQNLRGGVTAQTSNGAIDVSDIRGDAALRSSNGRIAAERVSGNVEAETSNSAINVQLDRSPADPIRLETSNGSIDLTLHEPPKAGVRATTSNGGVTVHLPSATSARITAETSNGSVSSDFDIKASGQNTKNHVDGSIGNGGPAITLRTSNGTIRILKNGAS